MKDYLIPLTAIISLTLLLSIALFKGINGTLLASGLMAIAGIGGYTFKVVREKRKKKEPSNEEPLS